MDTVQYHRISKSRHLLPSVNILFNRRPSISEFIGIPHHSMDIVISEQILLWLSQLLYTA